MNLPTINSNISTAFIFQKTTVSQITRVYEKAISSRCNESHQPTIETDNKNNQTLLSRKKNIKENQTPLLYKEIIKDNSRGAETESKPNLRDTHHQSKKPLSLIFNPEITTPLIHRLNNQNSFKENTNTYHEQKRNQKNTKNLSLIKYWNNKAPLSSCARNASILKKALQKRTSETKIILPTAIRETLNEYSDSHPLLDLHYWNKIVEHWLSLDGGNRQYTIESLLKHTTIPDTDPRTKLRGQPGVLAARDIPAYCVITPYAGLYCVGNDVIKEKACYGNNVDRYAVDCSLDSVQIDLCVYGHGNITLCINANTTYSAEDPNLKANTCFVLVIYQGWPFVFVVSIESIRKNHELLIDYGHH